MYLGGNSPSSNSFFSLILLATFSYFKTGLYSGVYKINILACTLSDVSISISLFAFTYIIILLSTISIKLLFLLFSITFISQCFLNILFSSFIILYTSLFLGIDDYLSASHKHSSRFFPIKLQLIYIISHFTLLLSISYKNTL